MTYRRTNSKTTKGKGFPAPARNTNIFNFISSQKVTEIKKVGVMGVILYINGDPRFVNLHPAVSTTMDKVTALNGKIANFSKVSPFLMDLTFTDSIIVSFMMETINF
ncbi:uncharacterized protein LOC110859445 isoform X2 [Folsomia candida]|uniref:uncharacterized protein LOC110859445 isoform X2 n=1 Tax=Folsomia candida TaxID=158441 RepID=UPI0016051EA1|nr:uncharacterized protein LOC110859445 isoform X2 [Folsomia candida]